MSAKDFKLQLNAEYKAKSEEILEVFAHVQNDALIGLVMKAPVDTGRFRSNMSVSISTPDLTTLPKTTIKGASQVISEGQNKIYSNKRAVKVYIQNNLPYAMRLENGWSKQAPQGMIAITLNELEHKYDGMII
jgi:hypothetical protein|tara:strand:- start:69 stop:467 length:399 start_codon:yes stop_codon:yes gene_type:complete